MQKFISQSPKQTENFAKNFATNLKGSEVIAFKGSLGMGKTCFIKGLARGLGFKGEVNSPTFAIVNEYLGGRLNLFHFDMYRVETWEDLYSVGFFEYMTMGGVIAVEWSENIEEALPNNTIYIEFEYVDENTRVIKIYDSSSEDI